MKHKHYLIFNIILVVFLFVTITPCVNAQTAHGVSSVRTGEETKEEKWRKQIDIDMSVPDFNTKKIDQKVMGWRLAKMIDFIQNSYMQASYNRTISTIRYEQTEDPRIRFSNTDKLEFVSAEKQDSIILIKWQTSTKLDKKEKVTHDIILRFVNGISDQESVNNLFRDISRYIRPDEENE